MKISLNIAPTEDWLPSKPLIISGPCSAESEEQVMDTCTLLAESGQVNVLRAGIWKPRTRPNAFEGYGEPALAWLKKAGKATGLPVSTEVANAQHVEAALKAGVDILWIGARTTVNPFAVQEIADALKGVDIPVFVKNPVNPDVQLWIGALERLNQAGITKLGAIHRGFTSFEQSPFRNAPKWELPIELKRLCPNLPIICDPSHIAGNRELLGMISQKAMDLDMDGLMIESHIQPSVAMSDAKQQVTPAALLDILNDLVIRESNTENEQVKDDLAELRALIDGLDDDILQTLSSRMDIAKQIGKYKRDNGVTILQVNRWEEIIEKRLSVGNAMGLSRDFLKKMLQLIHKESIRKQTEIMNATSTVG